MRRKRVLVVDDEERIRTLLVTLLESLDVEIVTVADGVQAGGHIAESKFDLVITDYRMPGVDGAELTRRIKRAQPSCRVIAITGGGDFGALRAAGADICLPKPFDVGSLERALRTLLCFGAGQAPSVPL